MYMLWILFSCTMVDGFCRAKAEDQAWVEVSQFYNSYKENSESALRRQPPISTKSKGKQRATDAEIWSTMGRELPPQFQGREGVDMALRLIEEASACAGSSTKLKERLAGIELKVCSIRSRTLCLVALHVLLYTARGPQSAVSGHTRMHTRDRGRIGSTFRGPQYYHHLNERPATDTQRHSPTQTAVYTTRPHASPYYD